MRLASLRASTLILTATLLGLAPTDVAARGLGGSWSGQVTQNDPPESYPMEMNLFGDRGSISYPSLGCRGTLSFIRKEGEGYWYREQITDGRDKCITGGMLMIKPHAIGGSPDWEWNWYSGDIEARGVVRGSGAPAD